EQTSQKDLLFVAFGLAQRLRLRPVLHAAAANLARQLAHNGTADALIAHLDSCRLLGLADRGFLEEHLKSYLRSARLGDNPAWKPFLSSLPEEKLPRLFAVFILLDRAPEASALASTATEKKEALACCLRRQDEASARAGLLLAEELADEDALRELHQRTGEFCFAREDWAAALEHFRCAGDALRVSQCHERLGRP